MEKRVIKFRFYDKMLKKMVFRNLLPYDNEHQDIDVMQFTGLLDLNGNEIYEGDIVKLITNECDGTQTESTFEVVYNPPCFELKTITSVIFSKESIIYLYSGVTVIGNIYENK